MFKLNQNTDNINNKLYDEQIYLYNDHYTLFCNNINPSLKKEVGIINNFDNNDFLNSDWKPPSISGLNNSERTSFVKQDTKSIFKNNPALRKFANTLTDIGGYANAIMQSTDLLKNSTKKKSLSDIGLADKDNKQTISDTILKPSEPIFVSPEPKVEKVSESTEVMVENKAE